MSDQVAVLAGNISTIYELHFDVPMIGVVISTLNTWLDVAIVLVLLKNLEAKIIFIDSHLLEIGQEVLNILLESKVKPLFLVLIVESYDSVLVIRGPFASMYWFISFTGIRCKFLASQISSCLFKHNRPSWSLRFYQLIMPFLVNRGSMPSV